MKRRKKKTKKKYPKYKPSLWNKNKYIQYPHNCYTYFLNKRSNKLANKCKEINCEPKNSLKPQPGHWAGLKRISNKKKYTCRNMTKRVLADNPYVYKSKSKKCKKGYYLGAMAVHPGLTYHFYRRDSDGLWSHKDGGMKAKRHDSAGIVIVDPKTANRSYPKMFIDGQQVNYSDFCGYFCIPNNPKKRFWKSGDPRKLKRTRKKRKKRKQK